MSAKRCVKRFPKVFLDDELFGIMKNGVWRDTVDMVNPFWTKRISSETLIFL